MAYYRELFNRTKDGLTPLEYSIRTGDIANVQLPLRLRLSKATTLHLVTAIEWCEEPQRALMVKLLLDHGAPVNCMAHDSGKNPLNSAIESGYEEIVKLLLEKGANAHYIGKDSVYPLFLAAKKGNANIYKMLLDGGVDATYKGSYTEKVTEMMSKVTIADKKEISRTTTALHIAAENGHANVVALLLEHGADINCYDSYDYSPLALACINGYKEVVEIFVNNVYCHIPDYYRYSCNPDKLFFYVEERPFKRDRKEIIKFLVCYFEKLAAANLRSKIPVCILDVQDNYIIRQEVSSFREICERELDVMKNERISPDYQLTFYDILTQNPENLAASRHDSGILDAETIISGDYKKRFPQYGGIISKKVEEVLETEKFCKENVDDLFSSSGPFCNFR